MAQPKLSVCLAIHNEAKVLDRCLSSIKNLADEIVIVDGHSSDDSVAIAKSYGAVIISKPNQANFHLNKKVAYEACTGTWVLQLDADEEVSKELRACIKTVLEADAPPDFLDSMPPTKAKLFRRHRSVIESRDQVDLSSGPIRGYFLARANLFLSRPLRHGGVYPDGVIRLIQRQYATLPAKHVHEQFQVNGSVSWLPEDLIHHDSPTFSKYWQRAMRYTDAYARTLKESHDKPTWRLAIRYLVTMPVSDLAKRLVVHKAILDGFPGVIFAICSALHHPIAFSKYYSEVTSREPVH